VAPLTDLLKGNGKDFSFGNAQEAAFLKILVLFTSSNTPILRHYNQERPVLIEMNAPYFAIGAVLSQKFEDGKIHPCVFFSRKLSPSEFNYDIFDKEMLPIVYALQKWRHYVLGTEHKTTIFSYHQNLQYFTKMMKHNRKQAWWAEILLKFDFLIIY
jgi:hypothetical protein